MQYQTTDKSIRKTLLAKLSRKYKRSIDTAIIPELSLPNGSARIDIAVVNGIMHGYELKSDFDSLVRLQNQMIAYNLIFDKVTLVVGKKHLIDALHIIPEWWGITIARTSDSSEITKLVPIREAVNNPEQNLHIIANMLWKNEMLCILENSGYSQKLANKSKNYVCDVLVNSIDNIELKRQVRKMLIYRKRLNASSLFAEV